MSQDSPTTPRRSPEPKAPQAQTPTAGTEPEPLHECITQLVSLLTHEALRKQSRFHLETAGLASKLYAGGAMIIGLPRKEGEPPEISYIGGRFRLSAEH